MNLNIKVNEDDFSKVVYALKNLSKSEESLLKTAVNNTSRKAQKILVQKASREYAGDAGKQSKIMGSSDIKKGSASHPLATITFRSSVHEIKEFHVSSLNISKTIYRKDGKRGGQRIKGNVLKGKGKTLDKAFVVQFKSGHIAVVSRIPGSRMVSNPKKEKLRKLLSPSYPVMIGGERVYGKTHEEIADILHGEIEKALAKVMGGR